jgi:isoquinoline 1-oxidoreductase subunit beta
MTARLDPRGGERGRLSRRALLKAGVGIAAGLTIGWDLPRGPRGVRSAGTAFAPNAWLRIDADGRVTIVNSQSEMGQGTLTSMAMIIAEELDADWSRVRVEQSGADPAYGRGGDQITAGSASIRGYLTTWRRAGAAAREMLVAAAAREWGVPAGELRAERGAVYHDATGRRLTYGELADKAATLPVPQNPRLKTPEQFTLIGTRVPRLDTPDKVTGRAIYGLDVSVSGMLVATVARCPVFGGKLASFDATRAKAVPGVRHVVPIVSGVAVVADGYWAARRGREALTVKWNEGANARVGSAGIRQAFADAAKQPGVVARRDGDATRALAAARRVVEAVYEAPFLAHATMEPQNCTAHVRPDGCDVWAPTQAQTWAQDEAMRITGLPREKVRVHTTYLGGGFGRRGEVDYVIEAVELAKAVKAPVKVVWSREDDIQHDFYRPASHNVLRAALGPDGAPTAWLHRIVSPGIVAQRSRMWLRRVDGTAVEGAANQPYAIPNVQVEWTHKDLGIPVGYWRSVGASLNAFVVESFVDELAHAAGKDPLEYRRDLLRRSARHRGVLELAAARAGWDTPAPAGRHRGIAVAFSYGSWAAQVAEVSVGDDGRVRVHRVVCAIDCGLAINPDQIRAQMEGGIVWGLSAAVHGEITVAGGRVQQSNFHDYRVLRIDEMPVVEVHIVPSAEAPGGVGEPGVPPIAPAVCNAIFAATGKRVRRLPIRADELRKA